MEVPGGHVFLMPHQMISSTPTTAAAPTRFRTAPHEFYDGSMATTTELGSLPGGQLLPHQMYSPTQEHAAAPGPPPASPTRLMPTAPHEFYDGTMTTTPTTSWSWYRNGGFGAVPALADAIAGLPLTTVSAGGVEREEEQYCCAVCQEEYVAGDRMKTMPCAHDFHEGCIVCWLSVSGICPLCRFKLPAED